MAVPPFVRLGNHELHPMAVQAPTLARSAPELSRSRLPKCNQLLCPSAATAVNHRVLRRAKEQKRWPSEDTTRAAHFETRLQGRTEYPRSYKESLSRGRNATV